jgi:DNA recombination protein RmuC
MEILLVITIGLVVVGFAVVIGIINAKLAGLKDDSALGLIKQDLQGMNQTLSQTQAHMNQRLDKAAAVFGSLQNELGKMQELGRSIRDIQDVLKSPKQRGNIGEQLMQDLIRQQIPKNSYAMQHAFRSGDKVDAVIKTKNGMIPIDSKFPSENFLKFSQTKGEEPKARAKKYIMPAEGTVDFALMYVPGEAVYYEIMTNTDLSEYAASVRVYMVSPHSFYYFLQTVLLSLEGEVIEAKAKEVMNYLKGIQGDSKRFGEDLALVDKHLTNAKKASDNAATSYAKLSGKIDSANRLSGETVEKIETAAPETADIAERVEEKV